MLIKYYLSYYAKLPDDTNPFVIKDIVSDSFRLRFRESNGLHIKGWAMDFPILERSFASDVEIPLSKKEICVILLASL